MYRKTNRKLCKLSPLSKNGSKCTSVSCPFLQIRIGMFSSKNFNIVCNRGGLFTEVIFKAGFANFTNCMITSSYIIGLLCFQHHFERHILLGTLFQM